MSAPWTTGEGRFLILPRLAGSPERGCGPGFDEETGADVLITVSGLQESTAQTLRASLAPDVPGVSRLLHVGPVDGQPLWALVEELPPDAAPVGERRGDPLPTGEVARLVARIGDSIGQARGHGRPLVGLRPELVFCSPDAVMVAPRCEPFLTTAARPCTGQLPVFPRVYLSPEALALRPVDERSDVFSLCAMAAAWVTGVHPFEERTLMAHVMAIASGSPGRLPERWDGPLRAGMARDPAARTRIDVLLEQVARLEHDP